MGLIMIELLSGQKVFTSQSVVDIELMMNIGEGNFTIPKEIETSPLGPLLIQATALDPQDRFVDGYAFMKALQKIEWDFKLGFASQKGRLRSSPTVPTLESDDQTTQVTDSPFYEILEEEYALEHQQTEIIPEYQALSSLDSSSNRVSLDSSSKHEEE